MSIKSQDLWTDWIAENYKTFGTNLEFVTDKSGIGTQFVNGFGGIGGILRWAVKFDYDIDLEEEYNSHEEEEEEIDSDFEDFF